MADETTPPQPRRRRPRRSAPNTNATNRPGLGVALLHMLANGQYGFHRDELDIIMNARQLDWGYVAYPPLTPFVARLGLMLFGESLRGLRVFSAVGQGVVVVLVGLMARDFGGKRGRSPAPFESGDHCQNETGALPSCRLNGRCAPRT